MTDDDGDMIYELAVDLQVGTIEYKFTLTVGPSRKSSPTATHARPPSTATSTARTTSLAMPNSTWCAGTCARRARWFLCPVTDATACNYSCGERRRRKLCAVTALMVFHVMDALCHDGFGSVTLVRISGHRRCHVCDGHCKIVYGSLALAPGEYIGSHGRRRLLQRQRVTIAALTSPLR